MSNMLGRRDPNTLGDVESKSVGSRSVAFSAAGSSGGISVQRTNPGTSNEATRLWTDKWKPNSFADLVGNNAGINNLTTWLKDWKQVHVEHKKKDVKFGPNAINWNAKAVLLSGPPGIGKTTSARLVCEQLGFKPLEYNASDNRGKNAVDELSQGAAKTQSIHTFFQTTNQKDIQNKEKEVDLASKGIVLIFDECDGLSGGDRGGSQAMIQLIKNTSVPVICICNDRQHTKVRSLANSCMDIRFQKTAPKDIAKRMSRIAQEEGLKLSADAVELLAEQTNGDFRQILNSMQMLATTEKGALLGGQAMKDRLAAANKDPYLSMSFFDATAELLSRDANKKLSIAQQTEMFFIDSDMMPLIMQENYISAAGRKLQEGGDGLRIMKDVADAADSLAMFDNISRSVWQNQNFELMPHMATTSTIIPARLTCYNALPSAVKPYFPSWLGKNSTTNKSKRLANELRAYTLPYSSLNSQSLVRLGYPALLLDRTMAPLNEATSKQASITADEQKALIQQSVAFLEEYCLPREVVIEHCRELTFSQSPLPSVNPGARWGKSDKVEAKDSFTAVDSKIKAAFTRAFNATSFKAMVALPKASAGSKGKSKSGGTEDYGDDDDEEIDGEEPESDNDLGSLVKQKVPKAKAKAKSKAGASGGDDDGTTTTAPKSKARAKAKAKV